MITRTEARNRGYIIDDGQRPVAYKGPRFKPDEWQPVATEQEENLMRAINYALGTRLTEDTQEILRSALRTASEDGRFTGAGIARVIMTLKCNLDCSYCCNKNPSTLARARHIKSITELAGYKIVILTGGEPMLFPDRVIGLAQQAMKQGSSVYAYTAMYVPEIVTILPLVKGITYTLHAPLSVKDLARFYEFQRLISNRVGSFRLSIDPEIGQLIEINPSVWSRVQVKQWLVGDLLKVPNGEDLFILDQ